MQGDHGTNIEGAIKAATSLFDTSNGHRANTKKVLVILASSYTNGDYHDPIQAATTFKNDGGKIIAIGKIANSKQPLKSDSSNYNTQRVEGTNILLAFHTRVTIKLSLSIPMSILFCGREILIQHILTFRIRASARSASAESARHRLARLLPVELAAGSARQRPYPTVLLRQLLLHHQLSALRKWRSL